MTKDVLKYLQPNAVIPIDMETTTALVNALKERLAQEKALQALHNENERLGLYEDAYAQPELEPLAWGVFLGNLHDMFFTQEEAQEMASLKGSHAEVRPLYTTPPQRTEQEPTPEIKYKMIVIDDLHPQGIPVEQWVNPPQRTEPLIGCVNHDCAKCKEQQVERNFCSRCGKRTKDMTHIHTCTPPREGT
jgi:hypothetical protein